jgi:hypothetical protein
MEGWRQERLGSRAGTHRENEKNKNILTRKKEKTCLTLTGLLMEGTARPAYCERDSAHSNERHLSLHLERVARSVLLEQRYVSRAGGSLYFNDSNPSDFASS